MDRRWVEQVRVGIDRGGDVQRRGGRRWIEVLGRMQKMSLEEGGASGRGVEMGRDREVQVRFDAVHRSRIGQRKIDPVSDWKRAL